MDEIKVLVVGAGPAGLATAGCLQEMGIPFTLVEKESSAAPAWRNHYDRLCLHTVKQYSHLPDFPLPDNYPTYVPRADLVKYYDSYVESKNLQPVFNKALAGVRKERTWIADFADGTSIGAESIVFATGVNRVPKQPSWTGQELFAGEVLHSKDYKNPIPFDAKRVLVVGMGNTGAEIALDLASHGVETYLSVRSPVLIIPRDVLGRPTQVTAKVLAKLPFGLGNMISNLTRKLTIGDLSSYGIEINPTAPVKHLMETGATPVLDLGTVQAIKNGSIGVLGDIDRFTEKSVIDNKSNEQSVDAVILATGFRADIDEFLSLEEHLDKYRLPKSPVGNGELSGLYFVGFDNYMVGGVLGSIRNDAVTVAEAIVAKSTHLVG